MDYNGLNEVVCDRYYYVECKDSYQVKGYMLNYNCGNMVLLTAYGICHIAFSDVKSVHPIISPKLVVSKELQDMVAFITTENKENKG